MTEQLASEQDPDPTESQRSGGVNVAAEQVNIGGDVVGRDKVVIYQTPGRRFWLTIALIAGVVVTVLGVVLIILKQQPPPPMPDGYNITVAPFVEQGAEGTLKVTEDSQTLSDWLFTAISRETTLLPQSLNFHVRGPDQIEAIYGVDEEQRFDNACKIAAQHNATILIYGVVSKRDGQHQVEPAFCVLNKGFDNGSEVAGPDRLGKAVPYTPPLSAPGTLSDVNAELEGRVKALQHLVQGLAHYYLSDYDSALNEFRLAADEPHWAEGREVLYLLMGATQLHRYDSAAPVQQREEILRDASNNFAQAYQLNHDYARSYLGLGSVALQQATLDANHVNTDALREASGWYARALSSTDQPSSAHIPIKAAFALGQIHLTGYQNELAGWSAEEARLYYELVTQAYEANPAPELRWDAGHAYCQLGYLIGLARGDWSGMASKCHRAIDILETMKPNPPSNWIARYWAQIGQAEENNQRLDAARNAYRRAIEIGENLIGSRLRPISAEEARQWRAELDRLTQ
jgi:tetratricopeptide (TPR) repeat protein